MGPVDRELAQRLVAGDPVLAALLAGPIPTLVHDGRDIVVASAHWRAWLGPGTDPPRGPGRIELACVDGVTRHLELRETPFTFDDRPLVLVMARDVTDQLAASAALRDAEARFRGLFEQAAVGIAVVDSASSQMIAVNRKLCRITGYSEPELLRRGGMAITHPEDAALALAPLAELQAGSRTEFTAETRFIRADGSIGWVELTIAPLALLDGKHTHLVTIVQDISERKRVEAALRERDEQLRASQKLEAVGQLAGGIAHDFNNLLTVVLSVAPELEARLAGDDDAQGLMRDIHDAGVRASELTRQLLAFARRQIASPRVIALGSHVEGFSRLLQRIVGDHIAFVLDVAPDTPALRIDPGHLEQVLVNLVVNARDAMPDGGQLVLRTQAGPGEGGASAVLVVEDSGVGMPDDVRARVFEPFFTTKHLGHGTGLGLATVYGIVKQSGGEIEVSSAPGQGTRFRIAWPGALAEATNAAPPPSVEAGSDACILVVEDEDRVRDVVRRTLAGAGYQLLLASDGVEALALAETREFDLLLTDLVMPGIQGLELARQIRERRSGVPVLLMSGYGRDLDGLPPEQPLLLKPFGAPALLDAVRLALASRARPGG